FLPLNICNFGKIVRFAKNNKWVALVTLLSVFLVYLFVFKNDHPYNFYPTNAKPGDMLFLRNSILRYSLDSTSLFVKSIFFIPIGYSILSLIVTGLHKQIYYLIYPLTILFLSISWLIEPRYYLVPFTMFLLCKEEESEKTEYFTIAWFFVLSLSLFLAILSGKWFP
ncbi:MAG: hypothetical protein V2A78_02555, partial [bacterium]